MSSAERAVRHSGRVDRPRSSTVRAGVERLTQAEVAGVAGILEPLEDRSHQRAQVACRAAMWHPRPGRAPIVRSLHGGAPTLDGALEGWGTELADRTIRPCVGCRRRRQPCARWAARPSCAPLSVVTRAGSAPCRPRLEGSRQSERAKGWLMSGTTRFILPRNVAGGAVALVSVWGCASYMEGRYRLVAPTASASLFLHVGLIRGYCRG